LLEGRKAFIKKKQGGAIQKSPQQRKRGSQKNASKVSNCEKLPRADWRETLRGTGQLNKRLRQCHEENIDRWGAGTGEP